MIWHTEAVCIQSSGISVPPQQPREKCKPQDSPVFTVLVSQGKSTFRCGVRGWIEMGQHSMILVSLQYLQLYLLPPLQADLRSCTVPPNTEGRRDELRENNVDETLLGMQMNKLVKCEKNTRKHPYAILQASVLWGFSCGRSVCVSAEKNSPTKTRGLSSKMEHQP